MDHDDSTQVCPPDRATSEDLPRGPAAAEMIAQLSRALAHPARVTILQALIEKESCIAGELAGELPLAPSTVSQHLKVLKEAGLIKGEVDGPRRCYCVDNTMLQTLKRLVADL
ncbi:MAG: metalloregulator ArsR/SmtB family transcription factor [Myxococcota bacterium]